MNRDAVGEFTDKLVASASSVLEMFQSGNHPTEAQLGRLEGSLFPFVSEKLCGHKIVEDCECSQEGEKP